MTTSKPLRKRERAALVLLTALALLWPAFVNGGPFWFPDTPTYIRAADAAVVTASGVTSEWSDRLNTSSTSYSDGSQARLDYTEPDAREAASETAPTPQRPVISGRSIYYGMLLFVPMQIFGPWGGVAIQALAVAGLVVVSTAILARAAGTEPRFVTAVVVALLALATPLPFYSSMLMPDVFSGILILVVVTAIVLWDEARPVERGLLIIAGALIATFHTTHTLIAAALTVGAFLLRSSAPSRYRPLLVVLPVIIVAIIGELAFSSAVKAHLGQEPLSPPFLSARITSSGPGTAYLHRMCSNSPDDFALCAHRGRLPLMSDDFLWSESQENGLFQLLEADEQRRVGEEDKAFFLAVLVDDPITLMSASLKSFAQQLFAFNLANFNYTDHFRAAAPGRLPDAVEAQVVKSRAFQGRMPVDLTVAASGITSLVSLLIIGYCVLRAWRAPERPIGQLQRFALLLVFGVLANAAVCGMLSKPGARYQMRLIWLLPVAAAAAVIAQRHSSASSGTGNVVGAATSG